MNEGRSFMRVLLRWWSVDDKHGTREGKGTTESRVSTALTTARERKQFLDAQSADLNSAIETLEDAIPAIDQRANERIRRLLWVPGHRSFQELSVYQVRRPIGAKFSDRRL